MPGETSDLQTSELSVSLWRGGKDGRYQTFSVPRRESQTVLDVVTFVQRHLDPTLSYRFACRVGVCGSCAMTVNGKPRWTSAPMWKRSQATAGWKSARWKIFR